MLTRSDCLSLALMLDARDAELSVAMVQPQPAAALSCMRREVLEIRRLRRKLDALSGRSLDFTGAGAGTALA